MGEAPLYRLLGLAEPESRMRGTGRTTAVLLAAAERAIAVELQGVLQRVFFVSKTQREAETAVLTLRQWAVALGRPRIAVQCISEYQLVRMPRDPNDALFYDHRVTPPASR